MLGAVDCALAREGSIPVALSWDFEMDDPDHFSDAGAREFAQGLVAAVLPKLRQTQTTSVHVVTDSTIGYNDWSGRVHHGNASRFLIDRFLEQGVAASVDAINGSGFTARARWDEHFRPRVSEHLLHRTQGGSQAFLLIGGWNDVHSGHSIDRVAAAAASCARLAAEGRRRPR